MTRELRSIILESTNLDPSLPGQGHNHPPGTTSSGPSPPGQGHSHPPNDDSRAQIKDFGTTDSDYWRGSKIAKTCNDMSLVSKAVVMFQQNRHNNSNSLLRS
ncbi:hypothetical protein RIF29_28842 [Crotalaria pallida]|uniref:Uncharacterized protein n=1 Tax=Crotalaria pallida TaxID=3830 RepID=A0AAN9EDW3_CROPI